MENNLSSNINFNEYLFRSTRLIKVDKFDNSVNPDLYLIKTGDGRIISIDKKTLYLLNLMNGERKINNVLYLYNKKLPDEKLNKEILTSLITKRLIPLGLVNPFESKKSIKKGKSQLTIKKVLFSKSLVNKVSSFFTPFSYKKIIIPLILLGIIVKFFLYFRNVESLNVLSNLFNESNSLIIYIIVLIGNIFHEFGHSISCKRYNIEPGPIGLGVYFIFPVFYSELTDIWFLERKERIVVNTSGFIAQFIFTSLIGLLILFTNFSKSIFLSIILLDSLIILSLNPFLKLDGYWIFSDLSGIPNLRERSKKLIKDILKSVSNRKLIIFLKSFFKNRVNLWLLFYTITSLLFFIYFFIFIIFSNIIKLPNMLLTSIITLWNVLLSNSTGNIVKISMQIFFYLLYIYIYIRLIFSAIIDFLRRKIIYYKS